MPGVIAIEFDEVYTKIAQLKSCVEREMGESDQRYGQILSSLDNLDGATNASTILATVREQEKAQVTAEVAYNLLTFIEESARHIQERDRIMSSLIFGPEM